MDVPRRVMNPDQSGRPSPYTLPDQEGGTKLYLGDTPSPLSKGLRPSVLPFFSNLLELPQKPHVVGVEKADVLNAIFSIAMRSTPKPKANPVYSAGSYSTPSSTRGCTPLLWGRLPW